MSTATTVPENFGSGGSGLTPNGSAGKPSLKDILKDHETQINNGTFAPLSDTDPVAVGAAAAEGVATEASRQDHVHADPQRAAAGTNLTDADETVAVADGLWRKLPTLTGNRSKTLDPTGAAAGDQLTVTRTSTAANTCAFVNGGPGAGTLLTMPASKVAFAKFQFDGTNWALREVGVGS